MNVIPHLISMKRIELFCKIVELGSFTGAARVLYVSQPTVSEHISTLESGMGVKLLSRKGRVLELTPAGRIFHKYAVEILKAMKLGDIVMLKDILSAWGRGYFEGAATVGVVSCGSSNAMGQGIGVTVLLTSKEGELDSKIVPEANIGKYLGLRSE